MAIRVAATFALCLVLLPSSWAQTVRFDTNVGNIDMILNPTGNVNLKGHVDNILNYVESGRYDFSVLNRAPDGFVLQMGGFVTPSITVPTVREDFVGIESFGNVTVDFDNDGAVDFNTEELLNDRSTVTLALSGPPNTGGSSFFINVADNNFLDPQGFVPFARIVDMSTVDFVMNLDDRNLFGDPTTGPFANPTFTDVPLLENDIQVYVQRAFVLDPDPFVPAPAPVTELATLLAGDGEGGDGSEVGGGDLGGGGGVSAITAIPEPPALVLVVGAIMFYAVFKGPRRTW